ncbi:MAG: polysaccharide deacetylase family protein [Vicinamibacteria bacterium]
MQNLRRRAAGLAVLGLALAVPAARAAERSQVALTFDDLPAHGAMAPGRTRSQMTKEIVAALREGKATAFGFINAKTLDSADHEDVLRVWREAGLPLGNHAFSHMDLHQHTAEAFLADVAANEPVLERLMGKEDWRWFRFPFLHAGETVEKRLAVEDGLAQKGYRVAEVTIDFSDWAYHDPYARCRAKGDTKSVAWLKKTYLEEAARSIDEARAAARALYGREIPQVMLLHLGDLNAVMTKPLLGLLRSRSFDVVPLAEAQADAAYAKRPAVALPHGASLFGQVRAERGLAGPPADESVRKKVAELCQ